MADETPEAPKQDNTPEPAEKSLTTTVWAAAGGVQKSAVLQSAIQSVRDAIPVVYQLDAEIIGAKKSRREKQDGTEFTVKITYTPRDVAGKVDAVDVDRVIKGLEAPKSADGIFGADGDPDFLTR